MPLEGQPLGHNPQPHENLTSLYKKKTITDASSHQYDRLKGLINPNYQSTSSKKEPRESNNRVTRTGRSQNLRIKLKGPNNTNDNNISKIHIVIVPICRSKRGLIPASPLSFPYRMRKGI